MAEELEKKKVKPWKDWRIWVAFCLLLTILSSFLFKGPISLEEVLKSFSEFPAWALVAALGLCSLQVIWMGLRVWALTPTGTRAKPVVWAISYGQFANAFFPARAGDALKVAILGDKEKGAGLSFTASAGVLVADRPVDIVALLLWVFAAGAYKLPEFKTERMPNVTTILIVLGSILLTSFFVFGFALKDRFPELRAKLKEFGKSAGSFLNITQGLPSLFFAFFCWLSEFLAIVILVRSVGIPISLTEAVAVIAILNLAIALPISVANVGPFEAAMTYALTKLGVPTPMAISIAILHHAFQVLGTGVATLVLAIFQKPSKS